MADRVLVIEDDPTTSGFISAVLSAKGFEVEAAVDGFSAMRMALEAHYGAIFVDYHLPEMDGYACGRLLQTVIKKRHETTTLIGMTADRFGLSARPGSDAIFDLVLTKPFAPDALYRALAEMPLRRSPLRTAPPSVSSSAVALWRVRGIAKLPRAAVFPTPFSSETLDYCFDVVDAAQADCLLLNETEALPSIEILREQSDYFLLPLLTTRVSAGALADGTIDLGNVNTWNNVANTLIGFKARREEISDDAKCAIDPDSRLLAFMYLADKPIIVRRDNHGNSFVPYTGGFAKETILRSLKNLLARSLVVGNAHVADDGFRAVAVTLTAKGRELVCTPKSRSNQGSSKPYSAAQFRPIAFKPLKRGAG